MLWHFLLQRFWIVFHSASCDIWRICFLKKRVMSQGSGNSPDATLGITTPHWEFCRANVAFFFSNFNLRRVVTVILMRTLMTCWRSWTRSRSTTPRLTFQRLIQEDFCHIRNLHRLLWCNRARSTSSWQLRACKLS